MVHAYVRIADELRRRIADGTYSPGTRLPTLTTLARDHDVSMGVARHAVSALLAEGLITTVTGSGTYVREPVPVRRLALERYRRDLMHREGDEPATSFTHDHALAWSDYRLDCEAHDVEADSRLAALFGIEQGMHLLEKRLLFWARGVPQQQSRTYLLADMVDGTPVADPEREPWPGGSIAQLASLGIAVTRVTESVRARMPRHDEVDVLQIASGVPVLAITRRMFAGERIVEVAADIVIPADRVVLDYGIDL
ncbi:MAG: GntR family transcriptional regulator [Carbonactinosporaceae bacterium]